MDRFLKLLASVNTLAEASRGFIWRMDEKSAAACGDRLFPDTVPGTTLVNLSVWSSVSALQRFANMGTDGAVINARQSFFHRFEGRWIVLWWVPDGYFPEVAEGWARLQHLRRHKPTPYAFNLFRWYPHPVGEQDHPPLPDGAPPATGGEVADSSEPAHPAVVP